jgi:hypothetical protein
VKRRNWQDLGRKLVDRSDMLYTVGALQEALGEAELNFFGEGVLPTATYPEPFPVAQSTTALGGSVGNGVAIDPAGQTTRIDPSSATPKTFACTPAHATLQRWDLLVLRYKMAGLTAIPKPSDPILTVFLNLVDDFELAVVAGTASASPAYPTKGANDIVLAGLRVPANATLGTSLTIDLSVREIAKAYQLTKPVFVAETPAGTVNGSNQNFTLSQSPFDAQSILVTLDALALPISDWALSGQTVTLNEAPAAGQQVYVWYVAEAPTSQNPVHGWQETPAGAVDGANRFFTLTGAPADQVSTMLFVDGVMVPITDWTLQLGTTNRIILNTGLAPAIGQSVYVFYFVNPATVGSAPAQTGGGGGGTGGGGLVVAGTLNAPQVITPSAGIGVTADQRQMKIVSSNGGAQAVTASPQIGAGTMIGQELILEGASDANYLTLNDGNGLSLNGPISLTRKQLLSLVWDGDTWTETGRP